MLNKEIALIFIRIADILEIKDDNPFRIRAYRKAAQQIESLSEDVSALRDKKKLEDIPGIGKDLSKKIEEYIRTRKINFYEKLKKQTPKGVLEFIEIPGVGPKTAKVLYKDLKIRNLEDLQIRAKAGKIKNIPGLKEKTINNILQGIDFLKQSRGRIPLHIAIGISSEIISKLKKVKNIKRIEAAGSLRRSRETVRDIDIVASSKNPKKIMAEFVKVPKAEDVVAHGLTKSSIRTHGNVQVDLRVVGDDSYGAALAYLTGSKAHNVRLREIAVRKGLKINEYGVYKVKGKARASGMRIAGKNEKEIYESLNLSYVPPEMREDRGEIEAAGKKTLPKLIEITDIKADLHMHSEASDGILSLEEIAEISKKKGYEYIVITDHSKTLGVAGGLSKKDLFRQMKQIDMINKKMKGLRILKGTEVEILGDGRLDYSDAVLKELDFVIAAVHSGFKQPENVLTERIMRAMENKNVSMIAHPTGRLMGVRDAYEINMEKILKCARDAKTTLEINSYPDRLDLNDINTKAAKEAGVTIGIGTDSHTREQFDNMAFGISVARRGWLEKKDVLNTLNLEDFLRKIKKT
ncbi:MAG: DNA polymerase/3'-5' exonuclease PolX [Candidatus Omnitrophica bacterium]|nr:DNA polymerase/3'-5' exonuclease PolX [Candidatus Omnitrophota bacterium]